MLGCWGIEIFGYWDIGMLGYWEDIGLLGAYWERIWGGYWAAGRIF